MVDLTDDKVYAYQASGQRDSAFDFDLDVDNRSSEGITYANGKFYVVDYDDNRVYVYDGPTRAGGAP